MIPFNKPYLTGKESHFIYQAVKSGIISGNGTFTNICQNYFQDRYGFNKCLLTTSCTDALEMAAILVNLEEGDEVIVPSYTFVSTALAFVREGAKIVFADSRTDFPGIDESKIEELITPRTRVIVVVHYAGIACDMERIMEISGKHNIMVVEDNAHGIDAYYGSKPLGGIGHLSTFSFHETKSISSGEGGMLVVNDPSLVQRAEIIWEKGTNRARFFRGEIDKYQWVDVGSSFLPSDVIAAFLYAQLECLDDIQHRRIEAWNQYYERLKDLENTGRVKLPIIPEYASLNGHMFYLLCKDKKDRERLISFLKSKSIFAVSHYLSLHRSPYYSAKYEGVELQWSDYYESCLIRLPLFYELDSSQVDTIVRYISEFMQTTI